MLGKQERELTQPEGTWGRNVIWVETKDMGCSQARQHQEAALVLLNSGGSVFFEVYFPSVLSLVFASRENVHTRKAGDPAAVVGGAGAAAGMAARDRGLQQSLRGDSYFSTENVSEEKSPISFGCQTAPLSFQITSTNSQRTKKFYKHKPPKEKREMEKQQRTVLA